MAIRKVIQNDEPLLRRRSAPIRAVDDTVLELLRDLADTMHYHQGIGIAAPQVGVLLQAIVIDAGEGLMELINPEIVVKEGTQVGVESCISFPGVALQLTRPSRVVVQSMDRYGVEQRIEATGALARLVCHEVDHLHGVLFFDGVSEEEVFSQLIRQFGVDIDGETQADGAENLVDAAEASVMEADVHLEMGAEPMDEDERRKEINLAFDLMADASWKMGLALELFRSHRDILDSKLNMERIETLVDALIAETDENDTDFFSEVIFSES